MARVTFSLQGSGQALAANFAGRASAVRTAAVRVTNERGVRHYQALYDAAPLDTGRTRRLLRLESDAGGLAYRTGWVAEDYTAEGVYPYIYVQLYGNQAGTIPGDDFLDRVNREQAALYTAEITAATKGAVKSGAQGGR